mmetsp:Transcript_7264/g.14225  ORF Transcript_7264/g.14225 Transcript_7264/m.14225 type:complete len:223 (+) Transcript_7264:238-906(+)
MLKATKNCNGMLQFPLREPHDKVSFSNDGNPHVCLCMIVRVWSRCLREQAQGHADTQRDVQTLSQSSNKTALMHTVQLLEGRLFSFSRFTLSGLKCFFFWLTFTKNSITHTFFYLCCSSVGRAGVLPGVVCRSEGRQGLLHALLVHALLHVGKGLGDVKEVRGQLHQRLVQLRVELQVCGVSALKGSVVQSLTEDSPEVHVGSHQVPLGLLHGTEPLLIVDG